jgi:hypothetical protein
VRVSDDADVRAFLDTVTPARRRRDAETLLGLMSRITGEQPRLSGSIVAFGTYRYRYASGHEGESAPAAFAPRKASLVIYLSDGVGAHAARLARLGPHRAGTVCIYITDLEAVDLDVLAEVIEASFRTLAGGGGTYTRRARDGAAPGAQHPK